MGTLSMLLALSCNAAAMQLRSWHANVLETGGDMAFETKLTLLHVAAGLETHDGLMRSLCLEAHVVVVGVDYR